MTNVPSSSPEMLHPATTPLAASTAVDAECSETGADLLATMKTVEASDSLDLPATVQSEIDALIEDLLREAGANRGKDFRSSPGYRRNAVRAGALLREYVGNNSLLRERAGVTAGMVHRFETKERIPLLTAEETQAIVLLTASLKNLGDSQRISKEEGKRMVALIRLLRKGMLGKELDEFRKKGNVTPPRLGRQEAMNRRTLTRDLAPDCFIEPTRESLGVSPASFDPRPHAEEANPAREPESTPVVTTEKLALIDRLTAQNETAVDAMKRMEAGDERLKVLASLIEQNRHLMRLLGIEIVETPSTPVVVPSPVKPESASPNGEPKVLHYRTSSGAEIELEIDSKRNCVVFILEGQNSTDIQ